MAEIINYNHKKQRLWAVWRNGQEYQAIDISGKSKSQIIELLPENTPNFAYQLGIDKQEAIENVKAQQIDALL